MKAFFIGSLYPADRTEEIVRNCKPGGIGNAANNLQWALIKGLDHFYEDLTIITQPNLRPFPKYYKKPVIKKSNFSHISGAKDYCLGYINIHGIKHLSRYLGLRQKLRKIIPRNEEAIVIIYALSSPFIKAVADLKNNGWHQLKTCVIVPDLPQFMSDSKNVVYRALKSIDKKIIDKHLKHIDFFVPLNENMIKELNIVNKPWVRIEGIYNYSPIGTITKKSEKKIILYTGNIGERYGVKELLEAFKLIEKSNYQLWVRGDGETKAYFLNEAKNNNRIRYFEQMPLDRLQQLLQEATVLVQPAPANKEFTKYFFPSKIMNYMASGTPVISTKIEGIPSEYYDYLYVFDNSETIHMRDKLIEVCEKNPNELKKFGEKAKKFVLGNKNSIAQARKIYEMISGL